MFEIEMQEMSEAFFPCWKAAGVHLSVDFPFLPTQTAARSRPP